MTPRRFYRIVCLLLLASGTLASFPLRDQDGAARAAARAYVTGPATVPAAARLIGYPSLHQQHTLSCEAAAASMATGGRLSEAAILARMPRNPNPWLGFRGDVDGGQSLADGLANYGIYAPPLARELRGFGYQTVVITGAAAPALLRYSIGVLRRPVEVWVTHYLGDWPAITGHAGGQSFTLIDGEHARLAIGYDARGIYTLDPIDGPQYDAWSVFLHSWARFAYMGVVVGHPLPRPAAPALRVRRGPGTATWSWTASSGPLTSEALLFRAGHPVWHALLAPSDRPGSTAALSGAVVLSGTVLATTPLSATGPLTATAPPPMPTGALPDLLWSSSWSTRPLTVQVHLTTGVPYTLTIRLIDPLGLSSPFATSPVERGTAVVAPAPTATPILPPPVPIGVRAAIAGPRRVRWTWPIGAGIAYRVVSYRYLSSRPVDYEDVSLGHSGSFARTVLPGDAYYAQVLAIDGAGLSSPATPPIPAPVISAARILGPVAGAVRRGGYGVWRWSARGATAYVVESFAYSGSRVVGQERARTAATLYRRRLAPGRAYHVIVWAVANDGEASAPAMAAQGLIYYPARAVWDLRAARLPDGRQRWRWAAQPHMRYRVQLIRYIGPHAAVLARAETNIPAWIGPPAAPRTTDYLQVWAVDAGGDAVGPIQRRGISSPARG